MPGGVPLFCTYNKIHATHAENINAKGDRADETGAVSLGIAIRRQSSFFSSTRAS